MKSEEYPPAPAKFYKLATESDFDYDASFMRFINKQELSDVEYFASKQVGYKCRTQLEESKARLEWTKAVKVYQEQERKGTLPPRGQKALENTDKKAGCDWLAPDGKYYVAPIDYYVAKSKGETT